MDKELSPEEFEAREDQLAREEQHRPCPFGIPKGMLKTISRQELDALFLVDWPSSSEPAASQPTEPRS